ARSSATLAVTDIDEATLRAAAALDAGSVPAPPAVDQLRQAMREAWATATRIAEQEGNESDEARLARKIWDEKRDAYFAAMAVIQPPPVTSTSLTPALPGPNPGYAYTLTFNN